MLFSIIIPTYNRGGFINNAIQSVLDQKFENFELIIVDDGSTDNTEEIVREVDDERVFYFRKINEERNIARNFGISKAKGDYISFLDSDDLLYPEHLEHAYEFLQDLDFPEIIHLNFEIISKKEIYPSLITSKGITEVNRLLINDNLLHCNSIFIKRRVLGEISFIESPNAIVGEDYYLWLRLASRYTIHVSSKITNAVIEHEGRSLNNLDVDKLSLGFDEIYYALKNDSLFIGFYKWRANRFFAYRYIFVALQLILNNRKKESLKYLYLASKIYFPCIFSRRFNAVGKHFLQRLSFKGL